MIGRLNRASGGRLKKLIGRICSFRSISFNSVLRCVHYNLILLLSSLIGSILSGLFVLESTVGHNSRSKKTTSDLDEPSGVASQQVLAMNQEFIQ